MSRRTLSLSQNIFGVGFPVDRHCMTAVCPISTTRVWGLWVMIGKPAGVLSAEERKEEKKNQMITTIIKVNTNGK